MTGFLGALPHELVSLALSSDDGGRTRQLFGIASTAKAVHSAVIGALADECNWDPGSLSRLDATVSLDDEARRTAAAALPRGFYAWRCLSAAQSASAARPTHRSSMRRAVAAYAKSAWTRSTQRRRTP